MEVAEVREGAVDVTLRELLAGGRHLRCPPSIVQVASVELVLFDPKLKVIGACFFCDQAAARKVSSVISGGTPSRTGIANVPRPRLTYRNAVFGIS
jgi:hypothetical protein